MKAKKTQAIEILLVEDNEGDVLLTKEAFEESKVMNNITVAKDGEVALEMLFQEGVYKNYELPDIILLDLNLPKKDGKEVLEVLKNDKNLRRIPVVVMTSSQAEKDVAETYNLHANSYIVKPVDFIQFSNIIMAIEKFWFTIVVLPEV